MFLALSRLGFLGLLLVLGVEILRHSLGDFLSAIIVDPTQTGARLSVSEALMAGNPPKLDEASAGAREALLTKPLFPEALTLLAHELAIRLGYHACPQREGQLRDPIPRSTNHERRFLRRTCQIRARVPSAQLGARALQVSGTRTRRPG